MKGIKRWKNAIVLLFLVVLIGIVGIVSMGTDVREGVFIRKDSRESAELGVASGKTEKAMDHSYKRLPRLLDPERRVEPLDDSSGNDVLELSALVGMPDEYRKGLVEYTQAILAEIRAPLLKRRRFYHKHRDDSHSQYPDDANPIYDRDVVIPLLILPRPDFVHKWSASTKAQSLGWRTQNAVNRDRGLFYGRTLIFEPGELSVNPICWPPVPIGTTLPSWELYLPGYNDTFFLELGKLTVEAFREDKTFKSGRNYVLQDRTASLHLGEARGAKLLGEFVTVPTYIENTRLRWVSIQYGSSVRHFLAYFLLDGNGARRERGNDLLTTSRISPYVRPLTCDRHQPGIKQHDMLLLPTPLSWSHDEWRVQENAHEEWCLDDWFPAQKDACWVIRETAESRPLQESFVLMPAREASDRPIYFISLFAETKPSQLAQELASLHGVSADEALNSPETMERLNSLYEKVRDFPIQNDSVTAGKQKWQERMALSKLW